MSTILVKIFATALVLSQVTTKPDDIKTQFDPVADEAQVVQILRDGCTNIRKVFDIEDINLDELISTAMSDPQTVTSEIRAFKGLDFNDLQDAYRQFCKNEQLSRKVVDIPELIQFYNTALADLPDHSKVKGLRLPGTTVVLDAQGKPFAELFEPDHRRVWIPLSDIPQPVVKAFLAAEDKRFYEHKGIDERGLIRAFVGNLTKPGRPQGGSTITQQVAKNLIVGDDVTYERKMREMVVASRVEQLLSKDEILELYLNSLFLGRSSWGVEMAARSYFAKSAKDLTIAEGAFLAGLTKGPNFYNPDRHPDRAQDRLAYVLTRLQEDGVIDATQMQSMVASLPPIVPLDRVRRTAGFYFVDHVGAEARTLANIESLTTNTYTVRSTIHPAIQVATEKALQEGLARYELSAGRARFSGPETNLAAAIERIENNPKANPSKPAWQQALENSRLPLYDVHWPGAVVLELPTKKSNVVQVGLRDGRILPLQASAAAKKALKLHDVVMVKVTETKAKGGKVNVRADLRVRPSVQGAAVVLENRTGRILAMSGGFSYPLSQLNRVMQAERQPGSALKPLTYLAALNAGLQPNTLIWDTPITLPPPGGTRNARAEDYWTPKNYDSGISGLMTLRRALENSKNLVTARLLDGGIAPEAPQSLERVCALAVDLKIYPDCIRHYPFVLGAQPVRMIDLALLYATIANEGARPTPHTIDAIERGGQVLYRNQKGLTPVKSADAVAFYQTKSILQGVLERGTARSIASMARYVGGKTGTSSNENDTWFAGFTNDVTIVVWVGYDNAGGKRRTLGNGQTGSKVAIPIFSPIVEATWAHYAPRVAMNGPSPETQRQIVSLPIDINSGDRITDGNRQTFAEVFRLDRAGKFDETQYKLIPREQVVARRAPRDEDGEMAGGFESEGGPFGNPFWGGGGGGYQQRQPGFAFPWNPFAQRPTYSEDPYQQRRRQRRMDPDFPRYERRFF